MSAIPGTRRQFRELVDGTIRVMIDIDPPYRKRFLDAFGEIDMAVAIVPLVGGLDTMPAPLAPAAAQALPERKGGELAKLAGKWCRREDFQQWLAAQFPAMYIQTAPLELVHERIAALVRAICSVNSRAELDHIPAAAEIFHEEIRKPFLDHIGVAA